MYAFNNGFTAVIAIIMNINIFTLLHVFMAIYQWGYTKDKKIVLSWGKGWGEE